MKIAAVGSRVGTITGFTLPVFVSPSVVDTSSVPVFALLLNLELASLVGNWAIPEAIIAIKITTNNAAAAVVTLTYVGELLSQTGMQESFERPPLSFVETGKSPFASTSFK